MKLMIMKGGHLDQCRRRHDRLAAIPDWVYISISADDR